MPNDIKDFSYPFVKLQKWLDEAKVKYKSLNLNNYNAAVLSTVSYNVQPSSRVILVKEVQKDGLIFYTNLNSRKAQEIYSTKLVSLLFYWELLKKQVRIEGETVQVKDQDANLYFATRPYLSKIAAWASMQSHIMKSRLELESRIIKFAKKYKTHVPRPNFWSGFKIVPCYFEFWQEVSFRLHKRVIFTKTENGFKKELLFP